MQPFVVPSHSMSWLGHATMFTHIPIATRSCIPSSKSLLSPPGTAKQLRQFHLSSWIVDKAIEALDAIAYIASGLT